jgi:hypothetical protein
MYRPSQPLADFVEFLWASENYHPPRSTERVLPTGAMDLIVDVTSDGTGGGTISGPSVFWHEPVGVSPPSDGAREPPPRSGLAARSNSYKTTPVESARLSRSKLPGGFRMAGNPMPRIAPYLLYNDVSRALD